MSAPLPDTEQQLFELRQHVLPTSTELRTQGGGGGLTAADPLNDPLNEEVVEMLWATVEVQQPGLNYNVTEEDVALMSRVWQYASGRFGFGNGGPDGRVVDFRPIFIKDNVVDVVDLRS